MAKATWLEHTADLMLKVEAGSKEELFTTFGLELYQALLEETPSGRRSVRLIKIAGDNLEQQLVGFLNELIYLVEKEYFSAENFKDFVFEKNSLSVTADGWMYDIDELALKQEIKAATYHDLDVKQRADKLSATVVFDI